VYNVVAKKVSFRYLISWWVSCYIKFFKFFVVDCVMYAFVCCLYCLSLSVTIPFWWISVFIFFVRADIIHVYIGVTRGCTWVHVHPQGKEKMWRPKVIGESCKCTPRQSKSRNFEEIGDIWTLEVVNLVVSACVSTFWRKKSALPEKILATPMHV